MPFIELVAQRRSPTPPPGMQLPENAKDWFRIENNADDADTTDIYVYESIGGWFGMWADDFIRELKQVSTANINLRLNSPGGSVFDGIAIANAIRSHPANVTVYVDSLAASIASVIALAGNRIVMMPQSQFMVHNASGAAYGDATEMAKMAELLEKQSLNIAKAYAEHTGRPLDEWQAYMAEETWFSAEEAVAVGLADEVIPMRPAKEEEASTASALTSVMNRTWDLSMYRYAGRDNAPAPQPKDTTASEGLAASGALITNALLKGVQPVAEEPAEPVAEEAASAETIANMTREDLVSLIRDVVQAALTPPNEDDEEEPQDAFPPGEEDDDEPPEDANSDDPEDAEKKLPPFLQPDEDEDEDEDDAEARADENVPTDSDNEWAGLVAQLAAPSPSADDVFNSLIKEAW